MTIASERLDMIRANASFAVDEFGAISGADFGLDAPSVAWVEGFIERQRASLADGAGEGLVNVLGSYLGEAILAAVPDAHWDEDSEGRLGIAFATGDWAYPFAKVAKQLEQGVEAGESIASFYDMSVNFVATGKLAEASRSNAP